MIQKARPFLAAVYNFICKTNYLFGHSLLNLVSGNIKMQKLSILLLNIQKMILELAGNKQTNGPSKASDGRFHNEI